VLSFVALAGEFRYRKASNICLINFGEPGNFDLSDSNGQISQMLIATFLSTPKPS
jgi:hypothetical protein